MDHRSFCGAGGRIRAGAFADARGDPLEGFGSPLNGHGRGTCRCWQRHAMSTAPYLIVRHLARMFGQIHAVDDVSFDVHPGQVVGLIGANGAGKTTMMRILATLDLPDQGTVHLGGVNVVERPTAIRRRLGWMPDHFGMYRDTNVGEYLDFYARAHGFRDGELLRRLVDVVEFTELGGLLDRPADALSKGQTQRLSLARTLLNDPEF